MSAPDFDATAEAFGLLADPVRVAILAALWRTDETPAPYSELRDAVGLRDSGRFNYHLSKLTDHFVAKTDDGYRLRPAGLVVLNAVYAGSYVDAPTEDGIDVRGRCPTCGGDLAGVYDAGMFRVVCGDCDDQAFMLSFPPRGVERRDEGELLRAVSVHARSHARRLQRGLCPFCGGTMDLELTLDADTGLPASTLVHAHCRNCGVDNRASVGFAVLEHPAVAGFLHEHGVDPDAPPWQFHWCLSDDPIDVQSVDPPRVTLAVTPPGDAAATLRVTVDETGAVVDSEREAAD
ncbi:ArsR/SmtB family transcription factor [Halobacterium yunchengense]|uniref:ArsR/SmtB family transcription factor n=1 Tax=Halobacterium yunchengense TaxID=3108497 RepID=UPI00300A1F70